MDDVHERRIDFVWAICREAGKERGPHWEGAAQRQEEAAGLWHRGEHQLPRAMHADELLTHHVFHTKLRNLIMTVMPPNK